MRLFSKIYVFKTFLSFFNIFPCILQIFYSNALEFRNQFMTINYQNKSMLLVIS